MYGRRRRRTLNEGTEVEEGEAPTGLEVPMEETLGEDAGEGPQASGAGAGVAPEGADDLGPILR